MSFLSKIALAGTVAVTTMVPTLVFAEGDPEEGEKVFRRCRACHVVDQEQNRVGPHLVGIMGREAGSVEGFNYSDAMKNSGITWNEETIAAYLADPKGYIPGNRMAFAGLRQEQQITDVIAYLAAQTGS
ncbi:MAG: c-type cytochrome [Geminicoccaceae bacterium]